MCLTNKKSKKKFSSGMEKGATMATKTFEIKLEHN